jgi:Triose-phosphate Transporter family
MTGPLALSPLESLFRLSPLAFAQALLCSFLSGELSSFYHSGALASSQPFLLVMAGNGLLAFLLNISSFSTNKQTGALTMTVCGNVKQCLTVLLGIALFGVRVGVLNGVGMLVALAGAAWYSVIELRSRKSVIPT